MTCYVMWCAVWCGLAWSRLVKCVVTWCDSVAWCAIEVEGKFYLPNVMYVLCFVCEWVDNCVLVCYVLCVFVCKCVYALCVYVFMCVCLRVCIYVICDALCVFMHVCVVTHFDAIQGSECFPLRVLVNSKARKRMSEWRHVANKREESNEN